MPPSVRKIPVDPAREALARAPQGEPLTDAERERLDAIRRRGPVAPVPHEAVMAELEERRRRGE